MPDLTGFWDAIDAQLTQLTTARTADDVITILGPLPGLSSAPAFFAGSGGGGQVIDALTAAGWRVIWQEASYYYAMQSPDRESVITYIEGDIYPEDRRS